MKDINVTITSKNQITLPVDIVRKWNLQGQRRLSIRRRGDELILKPLPSLQSRMRTIWAQLPAITGTATDKELQDAIRTTVGRKRS